MLCRFSQISMVVTALGLSGCANFSTDGGMGIVASLADGELKKDAIAIRTEEDAASAVSVRCAVADPKTYRPQSQRR
jgi:hypothetical protein